MVQNIMLSKISRMFRLRRRARLCSNQLFILRALCAGLAFFIAPSGVGSASAQDVPGNGLVDNLQWTYRIDSYTELAESGSQRGENIYFFKCFACHNHYAKTAPPLKDVYQHNTLWNGQRVNDDSVTVQIKNGSGGMPAFRYSLSDKDVADVLSYLRDGRNCCFESEEPPANPLYKAEQNKWPVPSEVKGGVRGAVRSTGGPLEGIHVQLIAPNGVRTTVFSDFNGEYEFPRLQTGEYTLRVSTPVPYKAYRRDNVRIDGAAKLEDIVLEKDPQPGDPGALRGALPGIQEIESQLSGAELLWNLQGTDQEKATFVRLCGIGCHSFQQIFRARFDERSWRVMIERMIRYTGNSLVDRRESGYSFGATDSEVEVLVKWLTKVRGPESKDDPVRLFPRASGASTRLVLTEYELPRRELSIHDVFGDAKGNIWYTSHRTPYAGVLDPRTGIATEHKLPLTPGLMPGTHHVAVGKDGTIWFSENWSHHLTRLDPTTNEFTQLNPDQTGTGNFSLAPDGFIWSARGGKQIVRIEPQTGKIVNIYPLTKNPTPYDNETSADGRFWAGGSPPGNGYNTSLFLDIRAGKMYELSTGDLSHSASRGGFDSLGNAWYGGRDGAFIEMVNEIDKNKGVSVRTFLPPTPYFPYTEFYEAVPDKNGEIWGGVLHGQGFVRFNPRTGKWFVYDNPEPSALSRHAWIDESTKIPTVWYPDYHTGCIVRIQPLE